MADQVLFELVSPEKLLISEPVDQVIVPGAEGDFGVLPGHNNLISTIRPGVIYVLKDGKVSDRIFIEGGFAEVTGETCTVLAEKALPVGEIDRSTAERAIADAREDVADAKDDDARKIAAAALKLAEARLAAAVEPSVY